jgi:hypothetical protein
VLCVRRGNVSRGFSAKRRPASFPFLFLGVLTGGHVARGCPFWCATCRRSERKLRLYPPLVRCWEGSVRGVVGGAQWEFRPLPARFRNGRAIRGRDMAIKDGNRSRASYGWDGTHVLSCLSFVSPSRSFPGHVYSF